jgi:hypothetical protein
MLGGETSEGTKQPSTDLLVSVLNSILVRPRDGYSVCMHKERGVGVGVGIRYSISLYIFSLGCCVFRCVYVCVVVWSELTVKEHLTFQARQRGVPAARVFAEVQRVAMAVGLDGDPFKTQAGKLSGGMRRRLSIGHSEREIGEEGGT